MSLKNFTVLCKLGEGAYSTVYKVERQSDRKVYALKKVKLGNLSEKQIENALNEVRILASFKSSHIVSYKEVFLDAKCLCIIMEFADDGDLYQKIAEHKERKQYFEEQEIWNVFIQILLGLKSLHGHEILHRDLKSANIFLSKNGEAKLGDLNVSKIAKNGLLYTQTGTPYYASPEVWKDEPYGIKSDIWSLGCVIYEMTTLQPPFQAEDMEGLHKAVTLGVYSPINPKFSKDLGQIIKMMLQQKPKMRPSADKLFVSQLVQKKIDEFQTSNSKAEEDVHSQLLKTIKIPRKLHHLTDRLPKPNYDNHSDPGGKTVDTTPKLISKASLPKLNKGLQPQIILGKSCEKRRKNSPTSHALLIQGRSKAIEGARGRQKMSKHLDRQIREELKRIYKVRKVGYSQDPRNPNKHSQGSLLLPPIRL